MTSSRRTLRSHVAAAPVREEADGEEADAEADGEEEEAPDAGVADDDAAADDETAPEAEAAVNDADAEDEEDPLCDRHRLVLHSPLGGLVAGERAVAARALDRLALRRVGAAAEQCAEV